MHFLNRADPTASSIRDTLDANELKDTSQAILDKIFAREAGNNSWGVEKDAQGKYRIEYAYAYTVITPRLRFNLHEE